MHKVINITLSSIVKGILTFINLTPWMVKELSKTLPIHANTLFSHLDLIYIHTSSKILHVNSNILSLLEVLNIKFNEPELNMVNGLKTSSKEQPALKVKSPSVPTNLAL